MTLPLRGQRAKPIIGLAGGIGSGKSFIGSLFERCGCGVINSDQLAAAELEKPEVRAELCQWWGEGVMLPDGKVDRKAIGQRVFSQPEDIARLNGFIHPRVAAVREAMTIKLLADASVKAVVWDTPLLFEAGLAKDCDCTVFVSAPLEARLERVRVGRGWSAEELAIRENAQFPLDKKRTLADYEIANPGSADDSLLRVRSLLERILRNFPPSASPKH